MQYFILSPTGSTRLLASDSCSTFGQLLHIEPEAVDGGPADGFVVTRNFGSDADPVLVVRIGNPQVTFAEAIEALNWSEAAQRRLARGPRLEDAHV
jgi:hypothetical protein